MFTHHTSHLKQRRDSSLQVWIWRGPVRGMGLLQPARHRGVFPLLQVWGEWLREGQRVPVCSPLQPAGQRLCLAGQDSAPPGPRAVVSCYQLGFMCWRLSTRHFIVCWFCLFYFIFGHNNALRYIFSTTIFLYLKILIECEQKSLALS